MQIQRVDHESRVHIDIETDDIDAEVARLEKLGATVDTRMERWVVMRAPSGQRFCIVRGLRVDVLQMVEDGVGGGDFFWGLVLRTRRSR